jgi:hypothetical protein
MATVRNFEIISVKYILTYAKYVLKNRRFGTAYRSHLKQSRRPKTKLANIYDLYSERLLYAILPLSFSNEYFFSTYSLHAFHPARATFLAVRASDYRIWNFSVA